MRICKIYAQCVIRPAGRVREEVFDIEPYIEEVANEALDMGYYEMSEEPTEEEFNAAYNDICEKIKAYWEETGCLDCGDYLLTTCEDIWEVERPNCCGSTAALLFA